MIHVSVSYPAASLVRGRDAWHSVLHTSLGLLPFFSGDLVFQSTYFRVSTMIAVCMHRHDAVVVGFKSTNCDLMFLYFILR